MAARILEADDFASTLYYTEDASETDRGDNDAEYFAALRKNPALAMIAAKIYDLIITHNPISSEHLGVLMVNLPDQVGFQLMLHYDSTAQEQEAFAEVAQALRQTFLNTNGITCGSQDLLYFSAKKEETLLKFIVNFAEANDYDFDRLDIDMGYNGDFAAFHAAWQHKDHERWRDEATAALSLSWVIATLPEKIYPTRELLLEEAYRTRHLGVYSREHITEAIEAQKPVEKRKTREGWTHAYH